MAREIKPVELRMVDEPPSPANDPVVRLESSATAPPALKVIAEPADPRPPVDARLVGPDRAFHEGRSIEPDVEVLLENPSNVDSEESAWDKTAKAGREPIPWGWFAVVALLLGSALTWSILRVKEGGQRVVETHSNAAATLESDQLKDAEAAVLLTEIERVARRFCEADSIPQLLGLIRHPDRLRPLVESHHAAHPLTPEAVVSVKQILPLPNLGDGEFWLTSLELASGPRTLIVEAREGTTAAVDWESAVCHQPIPWDEFAKNRPAGSTHDFRVYIEVDNFHSHEFANESRWACFRLTAKDSEEILFGYAPRDSPVAAALIEQLKLSGGRKTPCILRLTLPQGLTSRTGVVIERLVSPRWIHLHSPAGDP